MSGLLRRIKRSRPADAGEPLQEGQAAAPEGAAPATEPATGATEPTVIEQPVAEPPTAPPAAEKPVLLADPNTPAGVDPAAAPMRPPAGRRGRLRRRLRYLRRARELMLRDLGGLLYEIHRTGGGNVDAYGDIVRAKVQRVAGLDAEAHALETALAAPRAEAVVFQPGIGGTCAVCGELHGSSARFCANCGTAIGAAPAPAAEAPTPAPATRESVFGRATPPNRSLSSGDPLRTGGAAATGDTAILPAEPTTDAPPEAAGEPETEAAAPPAPDEDAPTRIVDAPGPEGEAPQGAAEPTGAEGEAPEIEAEQSQPGDEARPEGEAEQAQPGTPEPQADQAPAASDAPTEVTEPKPDSGKNPFAGLRNGRAEDHTPPELSSGDPLVSRETRK